jgi:integrase
MAIQLYCSVCKTYNPVAAKKCSKCATPFQNRDKKYRVDVSLKGKRVTRFADNITLAREIEATTKADMLRGEFDITHHKAKRETTLNELWGKYREWASAHKKSFRTDEAYYGKHIGPRFGDRPLSSITAFDIEKMKLDLKKGLNMHGRPYAAQTIKHQVVIIRRLFNLAKKWNIYTGPNPVTSVQMPRVDNQRCEYLSEDETDRLLQTLESWYCRDSAAFVKFLLLTGLRRGELFKLMWDDLDFERRTLRLRDPKGGKSMTIPLSTEALDVLDGLPRRSEYVFPGKNDGMRTEFKGPWLRIRKAAGLPEGFRLHGLRHNFGSQLVSSGVDLTIVRELMTHKDMATTQRYAHLRPDIIQETAQKSAHILTGARKGGVIEFKK